MVVRKLKAATYERVLACSLCNAVTSTNPCGTPFRRRADSVLAQFPRPIDEGMAATRHVGVQNTDMRVLNFCPASLPAKTVMLAWLLRGVSAVC